MTSTIKRVASCETFHRTGKSTQPALPTLPEKQVLDTEVLSIIKTIDEIFTELDQPTHVTSNKNTFSESFMQRIDDQTTQYLNSCFIQ
jgi:hypothetical protein